MEKSGGHAVVLGGELAREINAEHRAFIGTLRKTVEHGIRAGELLMEAKSQCEHGGWLPWLEANFDGAHRTAQEYMRLYNHRDEIRANTRDSAHLSASGALRELAGPSGPEPFLEVLDYVRREQRRLIKGAEEHLAFDNAKREEKAAKIVEEEERHPGRKGKTLSPLEQHMEGALDAMAGAARATIMGSEAALKGLDAIHAMWNLGDPGDPRRSSAAGRLREYLIRLSWEDMWGEDVGHGERYRMATWEARARLEEIVQDPATKRELELHMEMSTVTTDLTDTERTLLEAVGPDLVREVERAWEEDKDYELIMRRMETFTRPCDVPPQRELGAYTRRLTEEQMRRTFADLRRTGELAEALDVASAELVKD